MAVEFKVPELGDGINSADILEVLVKPGDVIKKNQGVIEVETDKATMEIPSNVAGKVTDVKIKKGDSVKVGQVLIMVDAAGNGAASPATAKPAKKEDAKAAPAKAPAAAAPAASGSVVPFKVPELGDGIASAGILEVLVKVGDSLKKNQGVVEAETDKATMEIPSTLSGTVKEVLVKKGQSVKPGEVLIMVESTGGAAPAAAPKATAPAAAATPKTASTETPAAPKTTATATASNDGPIAAAPSVRKFAREIGVDIQTVAGSGAGGRITIDDVKAHARNNPSGGGARSSSRAADAKPEITVEPMSKLRKVSATRLTASWEAPHVTLQAECDVTELEEMRQAFKKKAESTGAKLTVTAMFIKIVSAALKVYPRMNASMDLEKGEFHLKNRYNIGCAADTPRGLVVPVIRDVDQKNILQIARELTELSTKARDGKLTLEEMSGGTFTVTNLGGMGIGFFTPIINSPEAAILGMGRAENKPVWDGKAFVPKLMLPLSLSFDHRIVDGADGARFLKWLVDAVENPLLLSLEG